MPNRVADPNRGDRAPEGNLVAANARVVGEARGIAEVDRVAVCADHGFE